MSVPMPATGDQPPAKLCDANDLVLAHQSFRRLYALAPDAVRHADADDRRRIDSIAKNVALINDALHHHHRFEDDYLWDTLEGRRPACALHVAAMKRDHADVAHLLDDAPQLIEAWRRAPGPDTATALGDKLDDIARVLGAHLNAEEEHIVPVIEEVITATEWEEMGEVVQKTYHRSQIFMFYGLILEVMSPAERAELEKEVPLPIKVLYALVGRRQYARIMHDLRPTR
ncbi:hemerythrin domain-containing protein [Microbacterium pumilum]|uniref:Hemerythrin-like domain-containing protein n=1 Tax=Microbacterium pumilum TaxID=344165 RepID=A0ABN2SLM7_9MICO